MNAASNSWTEENAIVTAIADQAKKPFGQARPRKVARPRAARRTAAEPHFRSSVDRSPFIGEIRELFDANWGASAIHRWLKMRYSDNAGLLAAVPSIDALQRWRQKNVTPNNLIPASILHQMIGRTEASVDVLSYLEALIPLLANRVGTALQMEAQLGGLLTNSVDHATNALLAAMGQLWSVGQNVGLYPSKPVAPALLLGVNVTTGDTTLNEREQAAMWEAIYKTRHGEDLPWIESPLAKEAWERKEAAGGARPETDSS